MSVLDQSPWWLVPYVLLTLAMLHAMMELTATLLAKRPPADREPVATDELRRRRQPRRLERASGAVVVRGDPSRSPAAGTTHPATAAPVAGAPSSPAVARE
jgi:hypothetical protein